MRFLIPFLFFAVTMIVLPVLWIVSEVLYAPIRAVLSLASLVVYICSGIYEMFRDVQHFISSVFQVASVSEVTVVASEVSMWRTLWDDLFSQVLHSKQLPLVLYIVATLQLLCRFLCFRSFELLEAY